MLSGTGTKSSYFKDDKYNLLLVLFLYRRYLIHSISIRNKNHKIISLSKWYRRLIGCFISELGKLKNIKRNRNFFIVFNNFFPFIFLFVIFLIQFNFKRKIQNNIKSSLDNNNFEIFINFPHQNKMFLE